LSDWVRTIRSLVQGRMLGVLVHRNGILVYYYNHLCSNKPMLQGVYMSSSIFWSININLASFYDFYIGFCWNCSDRCDIFWYFILLIILYRGNRSQKNIFSMYWRTRGFISDSCSDNCSKLDQTGEC
jgi:hypothetical protein